jgi:CAAX protease family protein
MTGEPPSDDAENRDRAGGPDDRDEVQAPLAAATTEPADGDGHGGNVLSGLWSAAPTRPGLSTFTIEGRAAPALFVVGWLASILGLGIVVVGALAPSSVFVYFIGPAILSIGLIAGAGNQALERRARGETYAGPSPYLVFATIIATTYAIGYPVGFVLQLVLDPDTVPAYVVRLIEVALQAVVFVGLIRLTVVGTDALSWRDMGWRRLDRASLGDVVRGASFALPVIAVTAILGAVLLAIFRVEPEAPLPATGIAAGFIVQLIAGAVVAPLSEETVFRGFAITAWDRAVGERGALIRASLLFALAHVLTVTAPTAGEAVGLIVVGFATRLPVAFALGWLFLRTRSIWAPIGLHMTFNGVLLILGELALRSGSPGG